MKRFIATERWAKEWYQALKPRLKCLWQFICDNADACGVWEPNFGLAAFQIGEKVSEADLKTFGERVVRLPSGKVFVPSFIEFQYGKLSEACPAHKPVFRALAKHGIQIPYQYPTNSLPRRLQEEDKEEDKEKEEEAEGELALQPSEEAIYAAYPKKTGRQEAIKQIRTALKTVSAERLLERTRAYCAATSAWPPSERHFIPDPERWFKKGRWDDDPQTWEHKAPVAAGGLDKSKTVGLKPEEMPLVWRPTEGEDED